MSTAPMPDPFEDGWDPELEEEIRAVFDDLPFDLLDPEMIDAMVGEFSAQLLDSPDGEDPFETW